MPPNFPLNFLRLKFSSGDILPLLCFLADCDDLKPRILFLLLIVLLAFLWYDDSVVELIETQTFEDLIFTSYRILGFIKTKTYLSVALSTCNCFALLGHSANSCSFF